MKKILLLLISIPLIFNSCEKEEKEIQTNNNNNNITDVILGDWVNFGYRSGDVSGDVNFDNTYDNEIERHLNFLSDGTFEDYRIINGVKENGLFGTWENIGNDQYDMRIIEIINGSSYTIEEITTPIFYCVESVFEYHFDDDPDATMFYQKDNYYFEGCSEVLNLQ